MEVLANVLHADFDADAIARRAEREEREELEYMRLMQQYNATDTNKFMVSEVTHILRAEAEMTMCNGCNGLPCRKTAFKHYVPQINNEDGHIVIRYGKCNYFAKNIQRTITARIQRESAIPAQYTNLRLRDYTIDENNMKAVRRAQSFISNQAIGIYYYGECGSGKSMLAAIIANELIGKRVTIYMDVPAIMDKLRELQRKDDGDIAGEMNRLSTVPLLVMDDIGAERTTEWTTERLYIIINNRNNNRLPTIYTSNYTLNDLYQHYGGNILAERLCSRINATCSQMQLKGGDRRKVPLLQKEQHGEASL